MLKVRLFQLVLTLQQVLLQTAPNVEIALLLLFRDFLQVAHHTSYCTILESSVTLDLRHVDVV